MSPFTRRRFLQTSALAALTAPAILRAQTATVPRDVRFRNLIPPDRKLRIAFVGVGARGYANVTACSSQEVVALCDVDWTRAQRTFAEYPRAARYRDYRQMLDEMHDRIDAVVISTPDHMHFPPALLAIERGKHVLVEKPLTHTIGEARILKAAAAKAGVVTQMGNQGHASDGVRSLKEWIEAGVIGHVREVHCWTNRPAWPQGVALPAVEPVPATLDWNLWQGVAPERDYSPAIVPFKWRGFWDYGCGALGDMGCHILDAPFWALNLRGPVRVSSVSEGCSPVTAPAWSIITYEFPARGSLPPVKLVWYDGGKFPPVPPELGPGGELSRGGVLYHGDKGLIMEPGDYGGSPRLLPAERMSGFTDRPPKTIPRVPKGDSKLEWINACKGGPVPGSNFVDHSADLTEMVLLGNLALRAGRAIDWDPVSASCVGLPSADRFIRKNYRLF